MSNHYSNVANVNYVRCEVAFLCFEAVKWVNKYYLEVFDEMFIK